MAQSSDGEFAPDTPGSASSEDSPAKQEPPMGSSRGRSVPESQPRVDEALLEGGTGGGDALTGTANQAPTLPGIAQLQPAGDFDRRFAMSGAHDRWQGIATSTSKCDVCRKNRRGILYMCRQCSRNVCTECAQEGNFGDDKHRFDPKDVVWKAPAKKAEIKVPATPETSGDQAIVVPKNAAQGVSDRTRGGKGGQARATLNLAFTPESIGHNQSQPHCKHQPSTYISPKEGDSNSNVPRAYQTGYANRKTPIDTQLAAATLEGLRSGSCGIDDGNTFSASKVSSRQNTVASIAQRDQERMNPRPSLSKLGLRLSHPRRFEPYDLRRDRPQRGHDNAEEKHCRGSTPFITLPSPRPARGVSVNQRHLRQAQAGAHLRSPLPTDVGSRPRPSREVGIPPETIPNSPHGQVVDHHGASLGSPEITTSSSRRFPTSASLEPLSPPQTLPSASGPLPSIQHMVPYTPPTLFARPFPRSVRQTSFDGSLVRKSTARVMSPSQAARMASVYQPPPVSRVEGPPRSPLTGKDFPPAHNNAEAYGQWQIFKPIQSLLETGTWTWKPAFFSTPATSGRTS